MTRNKKDFPFSYKIGGVKMRARWRWLDYRKHVSEWTTAHNRHCYGLPKVGDVRVSKSGSLDHDDSLTAMRTALAILENRGIADRPENVDVSDLTAVKVNVGAVTHLVNLAPVRAVFPRLEDTFAPGTVLCRVTKHQASGRYYGIRSDETCQDYCERLDLPWPAYHHAADIAEYREEYREKVQA